MRTPTVTPPPSRKRKGSGDHEHACHSVIAQAHGHHHHHNHHNALDSQDVHIHHTGCQQEYEPDPQMNSDLASKEWNSCNWRLGKLESRYSHAVKRANWYRYMHTQPNTSTALADIALEEQKASEDLDALSKALAKYTDLREDYYKAYVHCKRIEDSLELQFQEQGPRQHQLPQSLEEDSDPDQDHHNSESLVRDLDQQPDNEPSIAMHLIRRRGLSQDYVNLDDNADPSRDPDLDPDECARDNVSHAMQEQSSDHSPSPEENNEIDDDHDVYDRQYRSDSHDVHPIVNPYKRKHSQITPEAQERYLNVPSNAPNRNTTISTHTCHNTRGKSLGSSSSSAVCYNTTVARVNGYNTAQNSNHVTTMDLYAQKHSQVLPSHSIRRSYPSYQRNPSRAESPQTNMLADYGDEEDHNDDTLLDSELLDDTLAEDDVRSDAAEPDDDLQKENDAQDLLREMDQNAEYIVNDFDDVHEAEYHSNADPHFSW
ncbi:hypothetical protein SeMB42_g01979 [Synchytrium endobioticum]|uniref:Uncharacterized protein n=1 Tax=Synchytrium endobioticum TaxID=286115 RepID=A0A507DHZ2_9FUNG|nr:hypothetical protein SeMB42_g01979 [Synchytrium endobioticum]